MNPLYLGTSERRLFGIYEPPAVKCGRPRAAVLCYPWGSEYVYAHRSMRHLATKLSQAGFHTLRFDFFGTGDSSGDPLDADLTGWEGDTESAIEGLKDIAGTTRVTLVGMRIGGTVAAKAAAQLADEIEALVMWDPIVSGAEYLRSMDITVPAPVQMAAPDALAVAEIDGYPLSARMLRDFEAIDLRADLAAAKQRSLLLVTERLASHEDLERDMPVAGARAALEFVLARCPWREDVALTGAVQVQAIQRIVEWLA
ncbi:MAG TPA: alpha/beta fold hydrolase [Steroidobacteraceae bacterium]